MSVLDEWESRRPIFVEWRTRRQADKALDKRLGVLGYKPQSGFHHRLCPVGQGPGSKCLCRELVAREGHRRSTSFPSRTRSLRA